MALILLNPGAPPLGQFDGYDNLTSILGGEVVTLKYVDTTGNVTGNSDAAAADVADGYAKNTAAPHGFERPVVGLATASTDRPLFLADDGTANYGTLFGTVVGTTAGQVVTGGTVLGPSTMLGSGKITCWDKAGLYGITLDALDSNLAPTVASIAGGTDLFYTSAGKVCLTAQKVSSAPCIGKFIEWATFGSLVTTPNSLVAALNSPSSSVSSAQQRAFKMAVIYFYGTVSNGTA